MSNQPFAHILACLSLSALLGAGCDVEGPDIGVRSAHAASHGSGLSARVAALEDRQAITDVAACYGRGHDAIFDDLGGAEEQALAILSTCFTDDVHTTVYFFDEGTPVAELDGLDALVGFVAQFAIESGYTHARNNVGNVVIELDGDGLATMHSSTVTPHFIAPSEEGGVELGVDLVSARYVDQLERGSDGIWRTYEKVLILDALWRAEGLYPLGPGAQG